MKKTLLTTTAALGLVMAANPASAFDENNWTWLKTVEETVNIDVNISSDFLPDGHVEIQKEQIMTGDVRAEVRFEGDYLTGDATETTLNGDALDLLDQEIPISGTWTFQGEYEFKNKGGGNGALTFTNLEVADENFVNFDATITADEDESFIKQQPSGSFSFAMELEGTATLDAPDINLEDLIEQNAVTVDATTELGLLQGDAVAIANFQEIQTETATFLDELQVHASGQTSVNGAANVEAIASAGELDPVAAAVDLAATAISNYLSVEGAVDGENHVLIADISQISSANISADASAAQDLSGFNSLGGYTGLDAETPGLVGKLNATAIGNFTSVKFGPSVDLSSLAEEL